MKVKDKNGSEKSYEIANNFFLRNFEAVEHDHKTLYKLRHIYMPVFVKTSQFLDLEDFKSTKEEYKKICQHLKKQFYVRVFNSNILLYDREKKIIKVKPFLKD